MDCATFQITVSNDIDFIHWQDLHRYVRDSIISVGLYPNFSKMDADCRELENTPNCLSATYHLESKTITKTFRIAKGDSAKTVYNAYLIDNASMIKKLELIGLIYKPMTVEYNITSNLSIIKNEIEIMPPVVILTPKFSLLKNLHPIYTKTTPHGTMHVKHDYIEYFFNNGSIDYYYTIEFDCQLHALYYKMYKRGFVNNDIIRYAFFKIYDYDNYMSLSAPTEYRGNNDFFNKDTIFNTDYIISYVDQSAEIIHEWKQITKLFPNDPIRLENRMKDNNGYYFILLGTALDHTLPEFIKLQFDYLVQLLEYLNCELINKLDVFNYAFQKWTTDQLLIVNNNRTPLFPD
jgi:hypothetical protein